jgi:cytoskeletal protein CcmA (bactofilin family)
MSYLLQVISITVDADAQLRQFDNGIAFAAVITGNSPGETISLERSMSKRTLKAVAAGLVCLAATVIFFSLGASQQQDQRRATGESVLPAGAVVNGDYFAFGSLAEISGTVNGDVYAFAGQVVVDGQVNGDVLAAGGRIRISGTVAQDVRAAGGHISITGPIGRNLTVAAGNVELASSATVRGALVAAGGNVEVLSPVGGNSRIAAGTLVISSRVGGHIDAAVGTLRITSGAEVQGDINYWSDREASISDGARIRGKISRRAPPEKPEVWPALLAGWIFLAVISFVSTLILGLLSLRFLPGFHRSTVAILRERPWMSLAIGFVAAVVIPVACILLFAAVLTIPIALILTAAYCILLYWARIFTISRIGEAILRRSAGTGGVSAFLVGLIVYYLLALIPVFGWLVVVLVMLFGLGAELTARKQFYLAARNQGSL